MNIVYLYTKLPPYQIPVFKELVEKFNNQLYIVYWDQSGNSPFTPPQINNVFYYKRSQYSFRSLKKLLNDINPDLIFVSGWQDLIYLPLSFRYKLKDIPIVIGFDDIWNGSLRQNIGRLFYKFFLYKFYSHAWVSGPRQYEYSKKLGFKDQNILYNLYSGDTNLYEQALAYIPIKQTDFPKNFLFVGRLVHDKAIDILVKGFEIYKKKYLGDWNLICIGNGPHLSFINNVDGVVYYPYMNQKEIIHIISKSGVFVLPSRKDVSPLVLHEFASAGMPLILSNSIGSKLMFLIEGFNGYSFESNSAENLAFYFDKISKLNTDDLIKMSYNSYALSKQHNHKFVAASLMSLFLK